jgi:hypothetical protein
MAKKAVATVEDPKEEPKEEMDYNEVHDTPLEAIIGEPKPGDEKPEEAEKEIKEEETPKETPKEEVTYEEVPFDPEEYKKQMRKEILGEAAKLMEKVTGVPEKKTEKDEELISPWAKEKRTPKDYEEISDWALEKKSILDARAESKHNKEVETQKKVVEDQNKQQTEAFNKFVDNDLEDLMVSGKIPRTVNKDDTNDPGVVARKALFQAMLDVNLERQKAGKPYVYSLKEIYYEHYKSPDTEVAGADAPVSPSKSPVSEEPKELDYLKDIQPGRGFAPWLTDVFRKKN